MRKKATALLMLASGCAAVPPAEAEDVPVHGSGKTCNEAPARALIGRPASSELAAEAMRLTGAGAMRWVPEGGVITMDYRQDRLNIHLDRQNRVAKLTCG